MKKTISIILIIIAALMLGSCGAQSKNDKESVYTSITAEEAKTIMYNESDYIILDVRTEEEFAEGHIPNAVLIPDYEIAVRAEEELKNKDQQILVYCRSGRRSKAAAQTLVDLGYTNVKDFGGILDWPYELVID